MLHLLGLLAAGPDFVDLVGCAQNATGNPTQVGQFLGNLVRVHRVHDGWADLGERNKLLDVTPDKSGLRADLRPCRRAHIRNTQGSPLKLSGRFGQSVVFPKEIVGPDNHRPEQFGL